MAARFRFRPRVFELDSTLEPAGALAKLAGHRLPILLDSAAGEPRRASLLAFDPLPFDPAHAPRVQEFAGLRELWSSLALEAGDEIPGPFHGGLLCALAYDLGAAGERKLACPPEPFGQPLFVGGLYVDFLVRDELAGRTWLVLGGDPLDGRAPLEERRQRILSELEAPSMEVPVRAHAVVRHTPPRVHLERIESLRRSIAEGDLYQANLAHRFSVRVEGPPCAWYANLRAVNPAPYMGFVQWRASDGFEPAGALLSASPELFFEFADGVARTRPIKGTRERDADPRADALRAQELLASEKDLAELAMIVDLERNDLGRCAIPGGVRVEGWPTLKSYARVHHLMADVVATLRAEVDAFDLLAALFPGGSISGAPKLAAMAHIADLEGEGRGFFCGSLGFVDLRGRAAFNILIRTFLWREQGGGELSFRVGGGITWSSDAQSEERETLAKAAGMFAALDTPGATPPRGNRVRGA